MSTSEHRSAAEARRASSTSRSRRRASVALLAGLALVAGACSSNDGGSSATASDGSSAESSTAPGQGSAAVGFIFVGPKDDVGYNQAAHDGSQAVAEAFPDLEIITAENVPETDEAARVMEGMVQKGAKVIFATSYGHLDAAMTVAAAHPDVVVVQQGNTITGTVPANGGTFFGTVYEPVYLAGIVAGAMTETDTLGYVYAFPIPQTLANINAFQLGAASVNPDVRTITVNTSNWCDPAKQADAAKSLLNQGVDVLTQHQDCQATVVKAAEEAGAMVVGYHADASSLAPSGWIAGSEWDWGDLYVDIVRTAVDGDFTGSKYNANYRAGFATGENPFIQSEYGAEVPADVRAKVDAARAGFADAQSVFTGPINGQDGTPVVPAGTTLDAAAVDSMGYFIEGVVGNIPKS